MKHRSFSSALRMIFEHLKPHIPVYLFISVPRTIKNKLLNMNTQRTLSFAHVHTHKVMNFSSPATHSKTIPTPRTLTRRCQHSLPLAQGCPTPDDVSNLSHHLLLASALSKGGRVQLPLPPPRPPDEAGHLVWRCESAGT